MSEHPMPDLEALAADQADANGVVSVEIRASLLIYRLSAALLSEAREAGRLREQIVALLKYERRRAEVQGLSDCTCMNLSAEAEHAYEMGRCPHQLARQALSPPTPDAGE